MHFYLFDQILETHVCESLREALLELGHRVSASGPVWSGHRFPRSPEDVARMHQAVDRAIDARPDVLFNFRASALLPEHLSRLAAAGIRTAVWQPDDPVLYKVCYAKVTDAYDERFFCGGRQVLDFYRYRGHKPGINLPFWVDTGRFRPSTEEKLGDLVFLGNGIGKAKEGRYEALCGLGGDITLYGRFRDDPHMRVRGYLTEEEVVSKIPRYRLAVNVAQSFASYAGTPSDFPGLAMLGEFFLPSRVVQYAALGVPALTVHAEGFDAQHYPPGLHARSFEEARQVVAEALSGPDRIAWLSGAARLHAERHLSSKSRARLLEQVFSGSLASHRLSAHEQSYAYKWME